MANKQLTQTEIWAEMARRKVQFHPDEDWNKIECFGLFKWMDVSKFITEGKLVTDMKKENRIIWVKPTKATWEQNIKPLIDKYTLEELTRKAGW